MAFTSSVQSYNLDHHPNWHQLQQQPNNQGQNSQLPPQPAQVSGPGDTGLIRPGSMVDRARLAKLPLPEAGLNCPRCDSTNTKFCYFNNYSLTQPRHFCKTCRRYWTRGGALRSVPVGGGCRRNKRTKNRSSKSPITGPKTGPNNSISESPSSSDQMANHFSVPQVPLMAALQNLGHHYGGAAGTFGGFQTHHMVSGGNSGQPEMGFQLGNTSSGNTNNGNNILSSDHHQGWRMPILSGFEQQPSNLFSYQSEGIEAPSGQVKVEENNRGGLNLSRQFLGISENSNNHNNQYWGANSWNTTTDFSGQMNASNSTSHFL